MAVVDALRRSGLKRSTRLLQLFSLMLLGFGALCLIPLPGTGWLHKLGGVVSIASGSAGIVGLAFTWYRALVFYTTFSWLGAALATAAHGLRLSPCHLERCACTRTI